MLNVKMFFIESLMWCWDKWIVSLPLASTSSQGSYSLFEKNRGLPMTFRGKTIVFSRTWSEMSYLFPELYVILCITKTIIGLPEARGSQLAKLFQCINNQIELNCWERGWLHWNIISWSIFNETHKNSGTTKNSITGLKLAQSTRKIVDLQ